MLGSLPEPFFRQLQRNVDHFWRDEEVRRREQLQRKAQSR